MYRRLSKGIYTYKNSLRFFSEKNIDNSDKFTAKDVAYESEYYYRQNKELLELLRKKTDEQVKSMQSKVEKMENKIKDYKRDINETLRFLKQLDHDIIAKENK